MKKSLIALSLLGIAVQSTWAISAADILAKADAIRTPAEDAILEVSVYSDKTGGKKDKATYEVLIKGQDKTLIKTLSPATDRGTSILMLGRDLWVFLPDVEKPVRISLQQRLLGDISNGDLARANFTGDYKPKLVKQGPTFYELKLSAVSEDVTYGQVELWVEKGSFHPIRAAFYAASGRLLKIGHYKDYRLLAGVVRPSRLVFDDAIQKGKSSTIVYDDMTPASHPDKLFTKDYLKKLKY